MKFNKPYFWDYKKPNILAYLLLPFTYLLSVIIFILKKKKIKTSQIKTICVGNIYIGGTGKTPISVKINKIINNLNFKTAFIKKNTRTKLMNKKYCLLMENYFVMQAELIL